MVEPVSARFRQRLDHLLRMSGLRQIDLVRALNVSKTTVSRYMRGRVPDAETLERLARLFDCSTDYLLGRSDDPHGARPATQDPSSPKQALLTALADWELTHDDVEAVLDVLVGRRTRRRETV